jgi:predicted esterase
MELEQLERQLTAVEADRDPFVKATGTLRRAYRSALDDSLQPYSLRVPATLEPGRRYPMVVSLHGSGQDDRAGIPPVGFPPEDWFVLAPKGRGISNCYSGDHAQVDLREALEDVLARYPVDPERLVLAGFSMGGYGVYRTHVENPKRYKALVVLSGAPDLGPQWLGESHPNFLDATALGPFRGIPMFIVHGTEDRNCPYAKAVQVVEGLKAVGAEVTFVPEEGRGHEGPSPDTLSKLNRWLLQRKGGQAPF